MSDSHDLDGWQVRPATKDDLDALITIESASFDAPWSAASLNSDLTQEQSYVYLATLGEDPIAYANFRRLLDECELLRLAVDPQHRRRKIGQRLLDYGLRALHRRGCHQCHLEVRQDNTPARHLYEIMGFKISGLRKGYYRQGDKTMDAVLYRISLTQLLRTQPSPTQLSPEARSA